MKSKQIQQTYRWMAPVYDALFRRFYERMRLAGIDALGLKPSDTVVLVGVGTGLDIRLLPPVSRILAIDLTPEMLRRAAKIPSAGPANFVLADGARLPLRAESASAVVLHLILSVTPDARALLEETVRILSAGGRVSVLDHFAPDGRISLLRRLLSRVPIILGTQFDRPLESMMVGLPLRVLAERRFAAGVYRVVILERVAD